MSLLHCNLRVDSQIVQGFSKSEVTEQAKLMEIYGWKISGGLHTHMTKRAPTVYALALVRIASETMISRFSHEQRPLSLHPGNLT